MLNLEITEGPQFPANYFDVDRIKAEMTWGEGPDVMIMDSVDGEEPVFIELTSEQALNLALQLVEAADKAVWLDAEIKADFEREKNNPTIEQNDPHF